MYYNFVRIHQTLKSARDGRWRDGSALGNVDVVDVLDAFEAKKKREAKVRFEIDEWKITGGFYFFVRATLEDGVVERIDKVFLRRKAKRQFGLKT